MEDSLRDGDSSLLSLAEFGLLKSRILCDPPKVCTATKFAQSKGRMMKYEIFFF